MDVPLGHVRTSRDIAIRTHSALALLFVRYAWTNGRANVAGLVGKTDAEDFVAGHTEAWSAQ